MKIVVCIKQVPDTKGGVKFNPDGTLDRSAMMAIMNPDDKAGLEAALRLKDQYGAEVTVLTMGLPKAEEVLREALAMGADKGILVTDRVLGGADTWATSQTIAGALRNLEYDLIITGRQAIDGDTAQVGPQISEHLDIPEDDLELYGKYKAKLSDEYLKSIEDRKDGKLILVTAINPTPAGEGKTTTSVGLGEAFAKMGKKAVIALREPSLGPCFGIKGGAAGGGYAQVVPMEDLNLHFTGDFHAITSANNLLAALLDNHIQQGNELGIDTCLLYTSPSPRDCS